MRIKYLLKYYAVELKIIIFVSLCFAFRFKVFSRILKLLESCVVLIFKSPG